MLSGGMDSLCIAWWKRPDVAITFDYGQLPAQAELDASRAICDQLGIEHHAITIDCRALGSGDMAGRAPDPNAPASDWWPYRNQMLITLGAMKAIGLGIDRLLIGSVRSDGSHRDGTGEFVESISGLLRMQEGGMLVDAPAIALSTNELLKVSGVPDSVLAWAHSCHRANVPCGSCRGCNKYAFVLETRDAALAGLGNPTSAY